MLAAGGFFDGRGLVAALAYGADGIAMGTRFLLTAGSDVPEAVKQLYLAADLNGTVVTAKVDGMPQRMLRTDLVDELEESSAAQAARPDRCGARWSSASDRHVAGASWPRDGRAMRRSQDRTLDQMALAANTPMMIKAALVDGDPDVGVLATGQVVGVIDDLPTCAELIDRIVTEAAEACGGATARSTGRRELADGPDLSARGGRVPGRGARLARGERADQLACPRWTRARASPQHLEWERTLFDARWAVVVVARGVRRPRRLARGSG